MDTDALPRRKDVRKWKLIGNRGTEVEERGREIYVCINICVSIQGRHEKGLSESRTVRPFSYLEVTERRGASETIEKE